MPKRVDHDERRREIADALVRVAVRDGLHATGFREVAAEAGVSVRLVQYYVQTKQQMLLLAMQHVGARLAERVQPGGHGLRQALERTLLATMPLSPEARELYVVYHQFFALSLTDGDLAAQNYGVGAAMLEQWVSGVLTELDAGLDGPAEAAVLVSLCAGLGTGVLAGTRSADRARELLRRHLDRVLSAAG